MAKRHNGKRVKRPSPWNRRLKAERQERSRQAEEYGGRGRTRVAGLRGESFEPGRGTVPGDTDNERQ